MNESSTSKPDVKPAFLRFVNITDHSARAYLVDYEGRRKYYNKIIPGGYLDVNTFTSEMWIFENGMTGDPLIAGGRLVFRPWGGGVFYESNECDRSYIIVTIKRNNIIIGNPLFSLKTRALHVVRDMLPNPKDIMDLEIPESMKDDLVCLAVKKLCTIRHKADCNCFF